LTNNLLYGILLSQEHI